jgi:sulfhydrogenase subunit beta (sulfur reductase)
MERISVPVGAKAHIARGELQSLIDALGKDGFQVLGPTLRDGAIVYDALSDVADLPAGWTDQHGPGHYQLEKRSDQALFGYAVGPHSWKRFLHPPFERLWRARREADGFVVNPEDPPQVKMAFIGVRACELRAIAIQDRVFIEGPYPDVAYNERRKDAFIVAVNCGEARGNCFCVSMGSGPKSDVGFDLSLTELLDDENHGFLVEVGSVAGAAVLGALSHQPASAKQLADADAAVANAASQMGRHLSTDGLKELLQGNLNHKQWDDVAARCLSCGNCTMVCPTCFCTTVEDHTDLSGQTTERVKRWDTCFSIEFSYMHGGSVRTEAKSRYRQWMTHKLANWVDQFGTSGCVGCGRCITWCPVGIDITAEVAAIRANPDRMMEADHGGA